jgi:hypothetical protein
LDAQKTLGSVVHAIHSSKWICYDGIQGRLGGVRMCASVR